MSDTTKTTLPSEKVRSLADKLLGTTDHSDELEDFNLQESQQFDRLVFRCAGCGWWCSKDECHELGDWFCNQCTEDINKEKAEETSHD